MQNTHTYYMITAEMTGTVEQLAGSYDRSDMRYELDAMRDDWRSDGYRKIKLVTKQVSESPDPSVYSSDVCKGIQSED
tara:strand:+ start:484 stop:717 length:234 start_codon:yes stop_codon:yes gene_type:complete